MNYSAVSVATIVSIRIGLQCAEELLIQLVHRSSLAVTPPAELMWDQKACGTKALPTRPKWLPTIKQIIQPSCYIL
jgi:hypothetical protein